MNPGEQHDRGVLERIARRVMLERGLLPDFSPAALAELEALRSPAMPTGQSAAGGTTGDSGDALRDLRHLLWASIDNDSSRDLDQLTVARGRRRTAGRGYWWP